MSRKNSPEPAAESGTPSDADVPTDPDADTTSSAAPGSADPADGSGDLPPEIAELSYETARDQLVEVVRRLESGQSGLEESIGLWERGEMLATRCQQWLDGARTRLDAAVAARNRTEGEDS